MTFLLRYARHAMLPEIGDEGQSRLAAARVALSGDPDAAAVAAMYLERAGVSVGDGEIVELVRVRAGRAELEVAAAFVSGALSAVEVIKSQVSAGRPASAPTLSLTGPEDET